jgi:PKD repeat protein
MVASTFGGLVLPAATAAPTPLASVPCGFAEPPTESALPPLTLRVNSASLFPTNAIRDPYYLDVSQWSNQIPAGWAGVNQGGVDFATVFHYPGPGLSYRHLSSTYDASLPISVNLTLNSVNETGKVFNFEIDIDLDHDGVNDTFISFPAYTTYCTLEPEHVNLAGTLAGLTAPMSDALVYLKVWRTDSVAENARGIARLYAGYIYESTITLPWINPAPTAAIGKPDNSETYWTSLPVTFSSAGTRDPAENLSSLNCKWTFGDNSTPKFGGCDANMTHIYRSQGFYNVSLNVTNTLGFTSDAAVRIFVAYKNIPPTVSATVTDGFNVFVSNFSGFAGVPYNFSAIYDDADNGAANVTVNWAFGDGFTTTAVNVTHTYTTAGTYVINLQAFDGNDTTISTLGMNISNNRPPIIVLTAPDRVNVGSVVTFSGVGSYDPDGFPIAAWLWDFGDQFCTDLNPCQSSQPVATHRYDVAGIYLVRLTISDGISTSTATHTVKVNAQPLAVCPPPIHTETSRNVTFDGSFSTDPDRDDLLFRWKFGDGFETDYTLSPITSHVYQIPKPEGYTAQLIVNDGLWTNACVVTVYVELINEPPVAIIWCSATTIWLGDVIKCSANQSIDEFELRYGWDFDAADGVACQDDFRRDVSYTFVAPGQYTITLCVTDNRGKEAEATWTVVVKENLGYCNQNFDMSPFLRQTTASAAGKDAGAFDASTSVGGGNTTAVKKGCWVAYSIELKVSDQVFVDIDISNALEGNVLDILMFDVPNFLLYKDQPKPVLPPNSLDTRCFKPGLGLTETHLHCEFTGLKAGTLYVVIDNRDLPVLTATNGPVAFTLTAKEPWPSPSGINPALVPYLIGGAGAAVVLVGVIWYLGRRAEKTY